LLKDQPSSPRCVLLTFFDCICVKCLQVPSGGGAVSSAPAATGAAPAAVEEKVEEKEEEKEESDEDMGFGLFD
jgi:ribosomal protein L12E/L44/L45/RPP1/RPP2